jgi:hypothetical protein
MLYLELDATDGNVDLKFFKLKTRMQCIIEHGGYLLPPNCIFYCLSAYRCLMDDAHYVLDHLSLQLFLLLSKYPSSGSSRNTERGDLPTDKSYLCQLN